MIGGEGASGTIPLVSGLYDVTSVTPKLVISESLEGSLMIDCLTLVVT
jgi:hypothetical protein